MLPQDSETGCSWVPLILQMVGPFHFCPFVFQYKLTSSYPSIIPLSLLSSSPSTVLLLLLLLLLLLPVLLIHLLLQSNLKIFFSSLLSKASPLYLNRPKMTKQNVVVHDTRAVAKSALNMAITVVPQSAASKPPHPTGRYIAISRKKVIKKLEIERSRINAWVDSMRASSPTHLRPTVRVSVTTDDHASWIVSSLISLNRSNL